MNVDTNTLKRMVKPMPSTESPVTSPEMGRRRYNYYNNNINTATTQQQNAAMINAANMFGSQHMHQGYHAPGLHHIINNKNKNAANLSAVGGHGTGMTNAQSRFSGSR